jgi:hypothetical protein
MRLSLPYETEDTLVFSFSQFTRDEALFTIADIYIFYLLKEVLVFFLTSFIATAREPEKLTRPNVMQKYDFRAALNHLQRSNEPLNQNQNQGN